MEPSEIQTALAAAVEEVLETMCFTTVLTSSEGRIPPEARDGEREITAGLHFQGSMSGGFRVSAPLKLARIVGAGFLGRDESELSDSEAAEVICELANMICGSVLSRLETEATFQITHPELTESCGENEDAGAFRWFDLGDGAFTVSLQLQPSV